MKIFIKAGLLVVSFLVLGTGLFLLAGRAQASSGTFTTYITYTYFGPSGWTVHPSNSITVPYGTVLLLDYNNRWNFTTGCFPGAGEPRCVPPEWLSSVSTTVIWKQLSCPGGAACYWYSRDAGNPLQLTWGIIPNFLYSPRIDMSGMAPGTYSIVFTTEEHPNACAQSGGTCIPPTSATANITILPPPQPTLSLSPASLSFSGIAGVSASGAQTVTLRNTGSAQLDSWTATPNQSWCHTSPASGGALAAGGQTTFNVYVDTVGSAGSYSCTVTVTGPNVTNPNQTVAVSYNVIPPTSLTFSASPVTVPYNGSSTLTWSTTGNPTSCTASGDWSGAKPTSGSQSTGNLTSNKTYTLSCTGPGGTDTKSVSVGVGAQPPAITISASPSNIPYNGSSTISWNTTGVVTSCSASGAWSGSKAASGSESTGSITSTRTYTLSCTGPGGTDTKSATVTVAAPAPTAVSISVNPTSIPWNGSSTISWSATGEPTITCTASGDWSGAKPTSGSQSTGNLTSNKTYTLSCTGPGGTDTKSATVTVGAQPPTVTFSASPTSVPYNGSSTLTWSTAGVVTSCTASGGWSGSKAASGSQSTGNLFTTQSYTLTCTGPGGTDSKTVSVIVGAPTPTAVSISVTPSSIPYNGSSTISWSATGEPTITCTASGDWSGAKPTSGSQSTGNLTSNKTYTLSCTGPGGTDTKSATVTVAPPIPSDPGSGPGYNSSTDPLAPGSGGADCGQVRITWTDNSDNETGFKVYRNTVNNPSTATLIYTAPANTTSYLYSPPDTTPYYYFVSAVNGTWESARVAVSTNPLAAIACQANLLNSDKDITAVNSTAVSSNSCGSTDPLPSSISLKLGDKLKFSVNVCNTQGEGPATSIIVTDSLINLKQPAAGWNARFNGNAVSPTVSGTVPNQTLVFDLSAFPVPKGAVYSLTFETEIAVPSNFSASTGRIQNSARINYDSGTVDFSTPLLLFDAGVSAPTILELR